ncbi:sigma-70 family RNA polymerase sigma factor [Sphingobacterium sp. SG20118]|uniref:sigma-70 family RNA polymerase sigma factor n=1 Tax=Sphingobacterium sp. SG20118 TaxID=3367156 RepID=UPI0037DFC186
MYLEPLNDDNKTKIAIERDENSFKVYFLANYKQLEKYAAFILKDNHLAEDAVSEVMWKLWFMGPDLMKINAVEPFLLKSLKNQCLNLIRMRQVVLIDNYNDHDLLVERNTPENMMISAERIRHIQQAVESLPPKTKEAFKLVKEEKKSYLETALLMGISKKTVDRHIQIALEKLWYCINKKK